MDKREQLLVSIDLQLKRQFKAKAAKEGTNMTIAVEALVRLYASGRLDKLLAVNEEVVPA